MRQKRLTKKRRQQLKRTLYIKPLLTVYIVLLVLTLTVDGTTAQFNDITSVEGTFQVGQWTPDIPDDEGWDKSSLTFNDGISGGCEQLTATVKNTGEDMSSSWSYHVYRSANLKGKPNWQRITDFEGETDVLASDQSGDVTFSPDKNGRYRFKFIRPEGHPGGDNGGWSEAIKLSDCEDKQSSGKEDQKDKGDNKDQKDKKNGKGQKKAKGKQDNNESDQSDQDHNNEQTEQDVAKDQESDDQEKDEKKEQEPENKESMNQETDESSTEDQKSKTSDLSNEGEESSNEQDTSKSDAKSVQGSTDVKQEDETEADENDTEDGQAEKEKEDK